jgi:hypothetical protein
MKVSINPTQYIKPGWIWLLILLMVALAATSWAAEGWPPSKQRKIAGEENMLQSPVTRVTIEKKMLTAVITSVGDAYAIDKETIISGADGKQIRIRLLPVPCEAEITYEEVHGKRLASRISVLRTNEKARRQWTAKLPE